MSYVDGIFERYWEEKSAISAARLVSVSPREVQSGRRMGGEDFRLLFCLEVDQTVDRLEERERRIVWWRHPAPWNPPAAWRRIARDLDLSHPIPQRIYRRAARRLGDEFRAKKLRPKPRIEVVEEEEHKLDEA